LEYPTDYETNPSVHNQVITVNAYVYLEDGPADHKIEMSAYRFAFGVPVEPVGPTLAAASDVTITNLVVEKYATSWQMGAIGNQRAGDRWTITDNEVRLNHAAGISFGSYAVVANNHAHHNGETGIKGGGRASSSEPVECEIWLEAASVDNNEIDHNRIDAVGFNPGNEGGGTKFACTRNLKVTNNYVHANSGMGLWTDINNDNTLYKNNTVENNTGAGIFHEISRSAFITENLVRNNGVYPLGSGAWTPNIFVVSSAPRNPEMGEAITIEHNSVKVSASGGSGIIVLEEPRVVGNAPKVGDMPVCDKRYWWLTSNVQIRNNTIVYGGTETGFAGFPTSQTGAQADWLDNNGRRQCAEMLSTFWETVTFENNTYVVPAGSDAEKVTLWLWHRVRHNISW
jgi:parallel beta-helix repeat protein